ncbi:hypothetical protein PV413_36555, partial [Streptomyces scabiei]|nr:hypothetical protein [Streptomyces scabiei]
MAKVPTAAVAASGLIGGYGVARWTKKRPLGGAVLAVAGAAAARQWQQAALYTHPRAPETGQELLCRLLLKKKKKKREKNVNS